MRNREWRRAEREKAIQRLVTWLGHYPFYRDDVPERRERAMRWYKHPAMCSSYCCGNPRKWFGQLSRQERIAALRERDED